MKKFLISIASIAGIMVVTGLAFAGLMATKKEPEKKETVIQDTLVEVTAVKKQSVSFGVQTQGTVMPRTETNLFPEVSGEVIFVSPTLYSGGVFEKGEVLLKIDPENYEADVVSAEANLARMEVEFAKEKALGEQALKDWVALGKDADSAPSLALREPQLKEAQANILSAEAALSRAKRNLRKTTIKAPYDGMVRSRMVDLGQVVNQGSQLAQVFAIDFVEIRLPLTSDEIQFIDLPFAFGSESQKEASPAVIFSSKFGDIERKWMGKIVRTEGTIDTKSRVLYAVARVEDPYGKNASVRALPMSVGMFVEAAIEGKTYEELTVLPRFAVKGGEQVWTVSADNQLYRRDVNVVRTDKKWAYIDSGLEDGDRVCLTALEFVVEGMAVDPVESTDSNLAYLPENKDRFSSL